MRKRIEKKSIKKRGSYLGQYCNPEQWSCKARIELKKHPWGVLSSRGWNVPLQSPTLCLGHQGLSQYHTTLDYPHLVGRQ